MKFSLTHIRTAYTRMLHRDKLKQTYMPARDWYVLVVIISLASLALNMAVRTAVFQERETEAQNISAYEAYTLDSEIMHEVVRLYEEKEMAYESLLSEGVEAKDPAW